MTATATTLGPQVHGPAHVIEGLRQALIAEAEAALAQYPQYKGHWDGWRVAEVTRPVRTKLGQAFRAGELTLVAPDTFDEKVAPKGRPVPYEQWPVKTFATAYSRSNRCDTAVPVGYVREVLVDTEPAA